MDATHTRLGLFTEIYEEHKDIIFSYLFYRVGRDRERAEDLAGDVFFKAFRAFEPNEHASRARPWLFTIARNTLIDAYRTHKPTEVLDEESLFDEVDLEALLDQSLAAEQVRAKIDELTPHQRTCISAYFFEDVPTALIAERHKLSPESVRQHISRGLASLRKKCTALGALIISFLSL